MRIVQVNTSDAGGGAEAVALALHRGYRRLGHDSVFAVGRRTRDDTTAFADAIEPPRQGALSYLRAGVRNRLFRDSAFTGGLIVDPTRTVRTWLGHEDFDFPASRRFLELSRTSADIVHCHNLHGGYFDLRLLPRLASRVPVMITAHDAWLSSGHCAHSLGCERWRTGCGSCPDLTVYPAVRRDATAYNWKRKRSILRRTRLFLATPSAWLGRRLAESMLSSSIEDARVIPNGVDRSIFRPGDRRAARAAVGLPSNIDVMLYVANGAESNPWKDYAMMRAVAERVGADRSTRELAVVVVGTAERRKEERIGNARVAFVPHVSEPNRMADYYRAADVYLHAAKVDTFPTAVLESLACGTPVVATRVGGIPEQVDDEVTGFLVEAGDSLTGTRRVRELLDDAELRERFGVEAANVARERFDVEKQIAAYLSWYSEILDVRH